MNTPSSPLLYRIYGLETEYALIFQPRENQIEEFCKPTRKTIFHEIERSLSYHFPTLKARHVKEGIFLHNGSFVHYEAQTGYYLEGLMEGSTPECPSPQDLVLYQAALDKILMMVRSDVEKSLAERGYPGKLILGKNSTDNKGNFYSCHGNYLVRDEQNFFEKTLLFSGVFLFFLLSMPFFFLSFLPFLATALLLIVGGLLYLILQIGSVIPYLGVACFKGMDLLREAYLNLASVAEEDLIKYYGGYCKYIFYPLVILYSLFLSFFVFRKIRSLLTAHLITRQIYTGSGNFATQKDSCFYELSQKAKAICRICRIYWNDHFKPIYDIKNFALDPLSLFSPEKRLHLFLGDANLSLQSNYLKVGTTALILGMIEGNHPLQRLSFKRPLKALHEISRDLSFEKKFSLWWKGPMSALEVQRYYLKEARSFYESKKIISLEVRTLLDIWEKTLQAIEEDNSTYLSQSLDWAMKKSLIDRALWGGPTLEKVSLALPFIRAMDKIFETSPKPQNCEGDSLSEILNLPPRQKEEWEKNLVQKGISWEFLEKSYDLYYQLNKIDLKYHELNEEEGYYFLLREALGEDIFLDQKVIEASTAPPSHTRAALRGQLIQEFFTLGEMAQINWKEFSALLPSPIKITFKDPFQSEFTEEQKEKIDQLKKRKED